MNARGIGTTTVSLLTVFWVALTALGAPAQKPVPPNILVILTDDQGRGDYGAFGTPGLRTPAMDRLFREGMEWVHFRANSSVCSPTRAALMTGMYPDRAGVPGVIRTHGPNSWGALREDVTLLPERLKRAGYDTAMIGKWHLGLTRPDGPNPRGFDHFEGFLGDMMDDYWTHQRHSRNYMRRNEIEISAKGHATDVFTGWACDYLESRARTRKPFFLYLAYNAPHDPVQPPPFWLQRVQQREPSMPEARAKLVALIEHLDAGIGQVLSMLDSTGLATNTLVVFTSDNGGPLNTLANNGPWRDGKGTMYEGGLRVPMAIRWPGRIPAGSRCEIPGVTMDLYPTLCAAAGVAVPKGLDGVNLLPACLDPKQPAPAEPRELYFVRREGGNAFGGETTEALIRGNWKILQNSPFEPLQLFNLAADPQEKTDLAAKDKRVFNEMAAALRLHIQRGGEAPWQRPGATETPAMARP
jgi:arylsulfatase A-like enzyme